MFRTILTASFVAAVSAHQNFHQFWVNEVTPGYQIGIRMPPSNSPVTDVTSDDIACNVNGSVVPSGVETIAANEGDKITVGWDESGHPGPITHFLFGPVDDAAQATGIGAGWFKIDELDYTNGTWANEVLENNGGNYTFSLPTGLASGEYLLRSEMLALHGAQTVGGAQFYIGCAQLKITGTGTGSCTPTISLPGAYNAEDDDIYIPDVYNGFDPTTYTAPGGAVATCGGGSGSGSTIASSTAVAAPSTAVASPTAVASSTATATSEVAEPTTEAAEPTTAAAEESSAAPTTSSATSAQPTTVAAPSTLVTATRAPTSTAAASPTGGAVTAASLYGQCGGANWTGPTSCAEGTCVVQNNYYSQCVSA
ncbi:hypothetical protein SLS62_000704 [Diatrype stigma]|uniref:lytic cellulose monooxygenase (C4-dehydrogenating) n=1 Tax=Diatrype stigma TaxID=117547 RepID=A0AAN9UX43_9PEZI